jgi:hypothetical protein
MTDDLVRNSAKKAKPPSGETVHESSGREPGEESISALLGFFRLLDEWDGDWGKNAKESGVDNRNEHPHVTEPLRKKLGQI